MSFAIGCAASLVIGYAIGASTTAKMIENSQAKARDLQMIVRVAILGHVGEGPH